MKKLLITLMIVSPFSFADWGDVYYCEETIRSSIARSGKQYQLSLRKFKFYLDKTKKAMVIGKRGSIPSEVYPLISNAYFPSQEYWFASTDLAESTRAGIAVSVFNKGYLALTFVAEDGIESVTADCERF